MRKIAIFLAFALSCLLPIRAGALAHPPDRAGVPPMAAASPDELRTFVELERQWDAAISSVREDNGDALLRLLMDDVVIIVCGEPPVIGKQAVRDHFEDSDDSYTALNVVSTIEQANVYRDLAVVRGTYVTKETKKRGWAHGYTNVVGGQFLDMLHRQDGSWRFGLSVWNPTRFGGECPDLIWAFRGYSLGMSKEDALAARSAKREEDERVSSWGGELWTAQVAGEGDARIYVSPSGLVIAFSVFQEVTTRALFDEITLLWGGFQLPMRSKVRVSGQTRIRMDHVARHVFCDANVLVSVLYDVDDKELDNPRMLNIVVWRKEFLDYTIEKKKKKGWLHPEQLWNPSHHVK